MKKLAKQFLGFSIAAIGVLWILNVTGVIGFDIFFRGWWTLLIILPCTAHLIAHPNWGSFSGIALGAILLLQAQGYIDWSVFWKLCLAIIFIAFGIMLIFSKSGRPESWNCHDSRGGCSIISRDGRNILKISSAFGEQNHRVEAEEFDGADIEVSFGSVRLDLRNATRFSDEELVLECFEKVRQVAEETGFLQYYFYAYQLIGTYYFNKGMTPRGLDYQVPLCQKI